MPRVERANSITTYHFREPVHLRRPPPQIKDNLVMPIQIRSEGKKRFQQFFNHAVDTAIIQGMSIGLFLTTLAMSIGGIIPALYYCLKNFFTKSSADLAWYQSVYRSLFAVADRIDVHLVKIENQKAEGPTLESRDLHDKKGHFASTLWRGLLFTGACFIGTFVLLWNITKRCFTSTWNAINILLGRETSDEDHFQTVRDTLRNMAHFIQENYL